MKSHLGVAKNIGKSNSFVVSSTCMSAVKACDN